MLLFGLKTYFGLGNYNFSVGILWHTKPKILTGKTVYVLKVYGYTRQFGVCSAFWALWVLLRVQLYTDTHTHTHIHTHTHTHTQLYVYLSIRVTHACRQIQRRGFWIKCLLQSLPSSLKYPWKSLLWELYCSSKDNSSVSFLSQADILGGGFFYRYMILCYDTVVILREILKMHSSMHGDSRVHPGAVRYNSGFFLFLL